MKENAHWLEMSLPGPRANMTVRKDTSWLVQTASPVTTMVDGAEASQDVKVSLKVFKIYFLMLKMSLKNL